MIRDYWFEIVNKLIEKKQTIATMESCTGGGIANEITNISGASSVIKESYVTYCNEAKIKQGVPAEVIDTYSVYSIETAAEMAKAVKKTACSNYSIGVTGQLGRIDPNNPEEKLNHVYYAIVDKDDNITSKEIVVTSDDRNKQKGYVINEIAKELVNIIK
ncbi:MAG: CinA family protein [Clostridia bacterium]|nr:CinA family protein [Clostridia bacterium]